MSAMPAGKLPLPELAAMKARGDKIVMVTAYDAPGARFAEDAGIDIVLVGDTAAMVVLGHEGTTVPVTVDEMLFLTRTVARALEPAARRRRPAVRLVPGVRRGRRPQRDPLRQGGRRGHRQARGRRARWSRASSRIVEAGIPVMGHIGLTPQSATMLGGFKTQGKTAEAARQLLVDARELEAAGCCSIVLEAIPAPVAARITAELSIPTIGIGAGPDCDGQVLVYHDLLGLTEGHLPRFVKRYANLSREIRDALEALRGRGPLGGVPRRGAHLRDVGGRAGGVHDVEPARRARRTARRPAPRAASRRRGGRAPSGWPSGRSRRCARRRGARRRRPRKSRVRSTTWR